MQRKVLPEIREWPQKPLAEVAQEWTILWCNPRETLSLAQGLRDLGVDAWAPMILRKFRPRHKRGEVSVPQALLPSLIFVSADQGDEALGHAERGNIPQCRFFLFNGSRAIIQVRELFALEMAQANDRTPVCSFFSKGDMVEVTDGAFKFQRGVILHYRGNHLYLVDLSQKVKALLPGFLLSPV